MTFLHFAIGFFLLLVAVFAWMVRDSPNGAKAIGIVYLACFSFLAYLTLAAIDLSTWSAVVTILVTWALGWFRNEIFCLFFRNPAQKAPID